MEVPPAPIPSTPPTFYNISRNYCIYKRHHIHSPLEQGGLTPRKKDDRVNNEVRKMEVRGKEEDQSPRKGRERRESDAKEREDKGKAVDDKKDKEMNTKEREKKEVHDRKEEILLSVVSSDMDEEQEGLLRKHVILKASKVNTTILFMIF